MNRTEVMERLQPICQTSVRQVEHTPRTRVLIGPEQVTIRPNGSQLIPVSENGVKAMANFVGLPRKVCQDLSPDLFGRVTTELLSRKERYNLLMDGDQVQDFSEYRGVRNMPVERVLSTIEQAIPRCDFHRVNMMGNYSAMLEIVGTEQDAVRRGDLVRAGALVSFSPINVIRPTIQSYVLRLSCVNGATSKTVLAEYIGGEGDDLWLWFRQSVQASYHALGEIVRRYQEMVQERILPDQRAHMLEALLQQAGITGKEAEAVRAQAIQEPPRNTYELANLITWASSHIVRSPEKIQRALNAGANFTAESTHASMCPLCHTRR